MRRCRRAERAAAPREVPLQAAGGRDAVSGTRAGHDQSSGCGLSPLPPAAAAARADAVVSAGNTGALMAISMIFYTRVNNQMTQGAAMEGPMQAQMKLMTWLMPIMMLVFFNSYAAGLSLYYLVANIITILQQIIIKKFQSLWQTRIEM